MLGTRRAFLNSLFALTIGVALQLAACDSGDSTGVPKTPGGSPTLLEQIRKSGELVVLTRNAPTVYYVGRDGLAGPEYDMTSAFAKYLGVRVKYKVLDNVDEILAALKAGEGHIAASGLTETAARTKVFLAGPEYQEVRQQVICRRGGKDPQDVGDLVGIKLAVISRSSYAYELRKLKKRYPGLTWQTVDDADTEELLEQVWRRKIDCTVADSNIVKINRRYHPELTVAFDLTAPQPLVWYMPAGATGLQREVQRWFARYKREGKLADVIERYYGFVQIFDYVDTRRYIHRIHARLPHYKTMFKSAAERYDERWTLLAAQAYQESHWNPRATSPTGVRGMMMLTLRTAKQLGIKDRLRPRASILGGAEYLSDLRSRLPDSIHEPDRTWIALAAYNVGLGHIRDARRLAKKLGKNPNSWRDLKSVLPLLAKKRYYHDLPYGYARGSEPVRYVARIRNFEDILTRQLRPVGG